jgi:CRP/FNR family transcriptional regulator, cyclic AMP receptor protein
MEPREPIQAETVRQVSLFRTLDEAHVQRLSTLLRERRYRKGELIFDQGDPGDCLYVVVSGRVRIFLASPDGREVTIRILESGTSFGELAVLDRAPRAASAATLDDTVTLVLLRDDFMQILRDSFPLVQYVLGQLTEMVRYNTSYAERLAFLSVPGRVAALLVQLADTHTAEGDVARLDFTQQELADFASTTREWVNRALRDFADRGLVRLERGAVIVLNRPGLRAIVE